MAALALPGIRLLLRRRGRSRIESVKREVVMANVLNPDAPYCVFLFAHSRFSCGAGSTRIQIYIYSKDGRELVVIESPGHIQFAGNRTLRPIGQYETDGFARLKSEFGKVIVKLSDSHEEPTFPTYEAFISHIV